MKKYKIVKDTTYLESASIRSRVFAKKGEVLPIPDNIARRLLEIGHIEELNAEPKNNKVKEPTNQKFTLGEKKKLGWYDIFDADGNVVYKVRGDKAAKAKLKELNATG